MNSNLLSSRIINFEVIIILLREIYHLGIISDCGKWGYERLFWFVGPSLSRLECFLGLIMNLRIFIGQDEIIRCRRGIVGQVMPKDFDLLNSG